MNDKEKLTEATMYALQGKINNKLEKKTVLRNQLIKLKESYSNDEDFNILIDLLMQYVKEELYTLIRGASNA